MTGGAARTGEMTGLTVTTLKESRTAALVPAATGAIRKEAGSPNGPAKGPLVPTTE